MRGARNQYRLDAIKQQILLFTPVESRPVEAIGVGSRGSSMRSEFIKNSDTKSGIGGQRGLALIRRRAPQAASAASLIAAI